MNFEGTNVIKIKEFGNENCVQGMHPFYMKIYIFASVSDFSINLLSFYDTSAKICLNAIR